MKNFRILYNVIIWTFFIIIAGNIILNPPMLCHSNGHFAFIIHPIKTIKEVFFEWGKNQDSFIYSWNGLLSYFKTIQNPYIKLGVFKATFAFFTQFSPVWFFIPLYLLINGIIELLITKENEKNTSLNSLSKLGIFIVIVFCLMKLAIIIDSTIYNDKNITSKNTDTINYDLNSVKYVSDALEKMRTEGNIKTERMNLGVEDFSEADANLINYKIRALDDLYSRGYYISNTPCDNYCEYLKDNDAPSEDIEKCKKTYYLSAEEINVRYGAAKISLNKEHITKEEFDNIESEIFEKNIIIMDEVDKIMSLTKVPTKNECTALFK